MTRHEALRLAVDALRADARAAAPGEPGYDPAAEVRDSVAARLLEREAAREREALDDAIESVRLVADGAMDSPDLHALLRWTEETLRTLRDEGFHDAEHSARGAAKLLAEPTT